MGSGIRFRAFALLVAGLTISLLSSSGLPASGAADGLDVWRSGQNGGPRPLSILPPQGALFGAFTTGEPGGGADRQSRIESFESTVGRKLAVERVYYAWDEVFPNSWDYWSRDQGRTLIISWNAATADGRYIKWADIASGRYDATIDARAADIKAFSAPLIFVFNHEPSAEGDPRGTPQDFIHAFQHVRSRFVADGVTNALYGWVVLAYTYRNGKADLLYPGDSSVDLIGVDGYNWYGCTGFENWTWSPFSGVLNDFYSFGLAHRKPMMVAEWGSTEDPAVPAHKSQWITAAATTLKGWPQVKIVSWFDSQNPPANCSFKVDTSQSSIAAFTAMGADPYFNPPTPPPPTTNVASYVSAIDFAFSSPPAGDPVQGKSIEWLFGGPSTHTVTDSSGMGYFDSGPMPAGSVYTFKFPGAGTYGYECSIHPSLMGGTIKVPMLVSPAQGRVTTVFTVTWASAGAPTGYVYDVQILRPGATDWSGWKTNQTAGQATFTPDSGPGTYSFRSRLHNTGNDGTSDYSVPISIVVSR